MTDVLKRFSISERNRIEAVWSRTGEGTTAKDNIVRKIIITILPTILEIGAIIWVVWFNGYEIAVFAVISWEWVSTIVAIAGFGMVLVAFKVRKDRTSYKLDNLFLSYESITNAYDKKYTILSYFNYACHIAVIVMIGTTELYIHSILLAILFPIAIYLAYAYRKTVRMYVNEIEDI